MSIPSGITAYLPEHPGLLPKWLLFVGAITMLNSLQAYLTTSYTSRLYSGSHPKFTPGNKVPTNSPTTPLSARTFGTWTAIQGIVRIYAAYNIDNPAMYQLVFAAYLVAWCHFMSEWLIFGSTKMNEAFIWPSSISTGSLIWMWLQWGYYTGN